MCVNMAHSHSLRVCEMHCSMFYNFIHFFFTPRCVPALSHNAFLCSICCVFESHEPESKVRHLHIHLGFPVVSYSGGNELTNGK